MPSHAKKATRADTKHQKMKVCGELNREVERKVQKVDGGNNGERPHRDRQGPGRRPRAARGGERTRDTAAEAGMWHGVQIREKEAGGWRVGEN